MPEQQQAMIPISITYVCDECGNGELELIERFTAGPNSDNAHICQSCGARVIFKNVYYPRIAYKPAEPILFGKGTK